MRHYRRIVKVKRLEKVIEDLYEKHKIQHGIRVGKRTRGQPAEALGLPLDFEEAEAKATKEGDELILKQLRPYLDLEKPLIDVIEDENRKKEPLQLDDRVRKRLERVYGKRPSIRPFSE